MSHLGNVINELVDMSQYAFLKGSYILDNIATAKELIFSLQKRGIPGHILKVDFVKAFDIVDWDFLLDHIKDQGFGRRWMRWVHLNLSSSKVSILVNGAPNKYIHYQRGDKETPCLLCCLRW